MDNTFFQSLNNNTVVLTANRRLASYLQHEYAHYQCSLNKTVWETPSILPFTTWIDRLWTLTEAERQVLTSIQKRSLWKKISQQNWITISNIQQAWDTLHNWDMDLAILSYEWGTDFANHCRQNQWITAVELPRELLKSKRLSELLPTTIFLIGFDDFPPLIARFLEEIKPFSTLKIIHFDKKLPESIQRYELENTEFELRHMAARAYQEHKQNSAKKIGCVIPNLTTIRSQVTRVFMDTFDDETNFNISAGENLTAFLLVQTALQVIRLNGGTLQDEEWESLLQSPYLMLSDEDSDVAALIDKARRTNNLSHINAHELLPLFSSLHARFPKSTYLKRWAQLINLQKSLPPYQLLSGWVQTFIETLQTLQWPGSRTPNSLEHQVLQRFLKALEELSQADIISGDLNFENAFALFNNYINEIVFQPKSDNAPIQVLGVLETAGLSFDALWIMGLDNENWPPTASPNPFLPYKLQIENNMPHASAERELHFTEQLMKRLLSSASEVYLSSPKTDGGRQLSPSQLITTIEKSPLAESSQHFSSKPLEKIYSEIINDDKGSPLANNKVRGGTAVLKFQAICPFKAYASFRLSAEVLETPALGLPPKLRGQLLHQSLELIWKAIGSQRDLLALSDTQLNEIISHAIDTSIDSQKILKRASMFLSLEKTRLINVINDWLNLEKERSPFTVLAQEAQRQVQVGPLNFQCRIDRIDELEDGSQLVVDYKSGYSSIGDWFSERPPEPQLPIYCIFGNDKPYDGLAFAQVRAGSMQFKGIIKENSRETNESGLAKIDELDNIDEITDWKTLLDHWKKSLEKLGDNFSKGSASVDPLKSACDYCELKPLCRVNECP